MRYLIIPGAPLLVIALALRDAESIPSQVASLVALALLLGGCAFVVFYALHRFIRKFTHS